MQRTLIQELGSKTGETVTIAGWINGVRNHGSITFLLIRDITGIVQTVVLKKDKENFEIADTLSLESVVQIEGLVKAEAQAPGGFEIAAEKIVVLSHATPELPIPVVAKGTEEVDQQLRLDWRWLDLRNPEKALIFKIWTLVEQMFREYWIKNGFIEIHSPKLMSAPSESGAELFEVKYFDRKAYLAQSPQFYKQMAMAAGFEKVFEIGPVFRAEPSFTSRHATEYVSYDMEMSFIESHQDIIQAEEKMLVYVLTKVKEQYGDEIKRVFDREITVPVIPFPQITIKEAKKVLKELGVPSEKDGDLSPEEERRISEHSLKESGHEFLFLTEYPIDHRAFYHMRLESDRKLTKGFDLLWNGLEITTGAQREHRHEQLIKQALEKGLTENSLEFYFNFFKYGCPPHGGFGFGSERMLMKLLDLPNVREAMFLYRGVKRLTP